MRCHICDKTLSEIEIQQEPDGTFQPCSVCMEIIMDAAYSNGFVRGDELEEFDLDDDTELDVMDSGEVESLDEDTYRSTYDHCDFSPIDPDDNDYD